MSIWLTNSRGDGQDGVGKGAESEAREGVAGGWVRRQASGDDGPDAHHEREPAKADHAEVPWQTDRPGVGRA